MSIMQDPEDRHFLAASHHAAAAHHYYIASREKLGDAGEVAKQVKAAHEHSEETSKHTKAAFEESHSLTQTVRRF